MFDYHDFKMAVGDHIGYGVADWDPAQEREIDMLVKRAYMQVVYPPAINDGGSVHTWNFLRPTIQISTESGVQDYDLPQGFVRFTGDITYEDADTGWVRIAQVSESEIRGYRMRTAATISDYPTHAATRSKEPTGSTNAATYELMLWPTPAGEYNLSAPIVINPPAMSEDLPNPVGSGGIPDLIMQSCLSIAEQHTEEVAGIHTQKFMERLQAMILADYKTAPQSLGYNSDGSEPDIDLFRTNRATYAGTLYD